MSQVPDILSAESAVDPHPASRRVREDQVGVGHLSDAVDGLRSTGAAPAPERGASTRAPASWPLTPPPPPEESP